jgi:uncharacterized membrane protein YfcA
MLPDIPANVEPWWYYVCIGLAVLITGISKAGFGGGVGVLAIPVMSLVVGPEKMLGITLPLLIACDVFSNLHYVGEYDWKRLRWLLPGLFAGILIGTFVLIALRSMPPAEFNRALNLIVGVVCLVVVAMQAYRLTGREVPTLPPHPASAASVGIVAGTVSTINHSAGPIVSIYLLQEKLPKRIMVGTLLIYFLIGNTAKLPTYVWLGIINKQTLMDSIWFIPLIPLGTIAGARMNHRVPEKPFAAVMYVGAALAAGWMIYKAMT